MEAFNNFLVTIDDFVWGPFMLVILVGTGIFLTIRCRFLSWRTLGYAIKSTLSKEARQAEGEEMFLPSQLSVQLWQPPSEPETSPV